MTLENKRKKKAGRELPRSKIARVRIAGVVAAKIGVGRVGKVAKKFFGRASAEDLSFESEARMVFEALSHMRGPALKLAQTLSMESGFLPEAYRREFQKAHYRVPSLEAAVVRRLLTTEFGKPPEEVFRDFEPEAFAAASLGQVHRAKASDGSLLAVKVQYPGVRDAVEADLTICRRLLAPFLRSPYVSRVISELEARFMEEVDYTQELANTLWFRERLKVEGVRLPQPYANLSGSTVITTELLPGQHLEEWLTTNPAQEAIDRAAQRLWEVFCISFFEWGRMHADPNPGNFLFDSDGSVGLIDFGCVKRFAPDLRDIVGHFMRAEIRGNRVVIQEMMGLMGVDLGSLSEDAWDLIERLGRMKSLPFQEEVFDFRNDQYDPEEMIKMAQSSREISKGQLFDDQTTETVLFDRNFHGLFNVFKRMGARVRLRNRWIH